MSLFKRLFGGSQKIPQGDLVPFLAGLVRPLQVGATQQINSAVRHLPDSGSQGRFMFLLLHVCLAAILHKLQAAKSLPDGFPSAFKDFAIAQWDRPSSMSLDGYRKMFAYTQSELGVTLVNPSSEQVSEVGILMLSIASPNQSGFTFAEADACGRCAQACWSQAGVETDKVLKNHSE